MKTFECMIEQTRTNTKRHEYRTALNQQHIALFCIQFYSFKDKLALSKDQSLQRGGNMFRSGTLLLIFTSTAYLVLETNGLAAPKIQYAHGVSQYLTAR
jgi:hypothetical protein